MGFIKIMYGNTVITPISTFVCDTAADIENLPTNVAFGSKAEVIEGATIYRLNSNHVWTLSSDVLT